MNCDEEECSKAGDPWELYRMLWSSACS